MLAAAHNEATKRHRLTIVQWIYRVDHQLQQTVSEFGPGCGLVMMGRYVTTTRTGRPRSALGGRPRRHRAAWLCRHRRFRRIGCIALEETLPRGTISTHYSAGWKNQCQVRLFLWFNLVNHVDPN